MSWIEKIAQKEAEGKLKKIYDQLTDRGGGEKVPNVLQVQSLDEDLLAAHLELYQQIMFGKSNLSRQQRELIAVVVSGINSCHY